ncbi:hypothetical protein [Pseudorhodobacter sp.]|uniref:hypothetical protein n=1 Tax=Pseudorhodobacter sp. TaxID=1934400 RepID=UPI002649DD6A|nr:hypothetical protein [Pseudorhodobacter sp.]MDN5789124.1 hypothetical protein [Pseudorhodobacter sp.]
MEIEECRQPQRSFDQSSLWFQFEDQREVFWNLVRIAEALKDAELAMSPGYNEFLRYGIGLNFLGGTQACRVIGLALIQGYPNPQQAERALDRFWCGLLPNDYAATCRSTH